MLQENPREDQEILLPQERESEYKYKWSLREREKSNIITNVSSISANPSHKSKLHMKMCPLDFITPVEGHEETLVTSSKKLKYKEKSTNDDMNGMILSFLYLYER